MTYLTYIHSLCKYNAKDTYIHMNLLHVQMTNHGKVVYQVISICVWVLDYDRFIFLFLTRYLFLTIFFKVSVLILIALGQRKSLL